MGIRCATPFALVLMSRQMLQLLAATSSAFTTHLKSFYICILYIAPVYVYNSNKFCVARTFYTGSVVAQVSAIAFLLCVSTLEKMLAGGGSFRFYAS